MSGGGRKGAKKDAFADLLGEVIPKHAGRASSASLASSSTAAPGAGARPEGREAKGGPQQTLGVGGSAVRGSGPQPPGTQLPWQADGQAGADGSRGARQHGYGAADDLDKLFGGMDAGSEQSRAGGKPAGGPAGAEDPFALMTELGPSSSPQNLPRGNAQERPEVAVEAAKERGNIAFNSCDYRGAVEHYSTCIRLSPVGSSSHVYRSNRAAAYLKLGNASAALADADECIRLKPDFAKGHARREAALELLRAERSDGMLSEAPPVTEPWAATASVGTAADSPVDDLDAIFGRVGFMPRNASAPEVQSSSFYDMDDLPGVLELGVPRGGVVGSGETWVPLSSSPSPPPLPTPSPSPSPIAEDMNFDGFPIRMSGGGEFTGFTEDGNAEEEDARAAQVAEDARLARAMQRKLNMEDGSASASTAPPPSTSRWEPSRAPHETQPSPSARDRNALRQGTAEKRAKSLYEKAVAGAKKYAALAKKGATELYIEMGEALASAAASPTNQKSDPIPAVKENAPSRAASGKIMPESGWMRDAAERASGPSPRGSGVGGNYEAPTPAAEGYKRRSPSPAERASSPIASVSPLISTEDSVRVDSPRENPELDVEIVDAADIFASSPRTSAEDEGKDANDVPRPSPAAPDAEEADLLGGFGGAEEPVDNEDLLFADDEDFFLEKLAGVSRSQVHEEGKAGDRIFASRPDLHGASSSGAPSPAAECEPRPQGARPPAAPLTKVVQKKGEEYDDYAARLRAQRAAEFADRVRAKQQEKVDALRAREEAAQAEQDGKADLQGSAGVRIEAWAKNKEKNVRALLGTLDTVLWEGAAWKKVNMGDLMEAAAVHKAFRRANLLVHTDKLSKATPEVRFIGEKLFHILQAAYEDFRTNER